MYKFEDLLKENQPKPLWAAIFAMFAGIFLIFLAWNAPAIASVLVFKVELPAGIANFATELKFVIYYLIISFGAGLLSVTYYREAIQKGRALTLFTAASRFRFELMAISACLAAIIVFVGVFLLEPHNINALKSRIEQLGNRYFFVLVVAYLVAFSVQSTFEEVYFRGFLAQYLRRLSIPMAVVMVITSLLFSAVHYTEDVPAAVLVSTFLVGLTFAIAARRTNGLEVTIGAHIANNLIVGGLFGALDNQQASEDAYLSAVIFSVVYLGGLELALRLWPKFLADSRLIGTSG